MIEDRSLIDRASVFRSFNPEIDGKEIFEYGIETIKYQKTFDAQYCKAAYWTNDPLQHDWYIDSLFQDQLAHKDRCLAEVPLLPGIKGDIIISKVDETVIDGASAVCSCYLFDDYDLPPIDTWFYLTRSNGKRLLFAWIPEQYWLDANNAIDVNCVDCIGWFKDWYPEEYQQYCLSV